MSLLSGILSPLSAVKNDLNGIYDQVNPFDGNRTYDTNAAGQNPGYRQAAPAATPNYGTGSGGSTGSGSVGVTVPDYASMYNSAYQQALKDSQTPVPRMVTPNLTSIYATAAQQAQQQISPVYQQMMSTFLAGQQEKLAQQQQATTSGKAALDTTLAQNLQDSATARARAAEDNSTNVQDINDTQAFNDRTEGLSFDAANRALNEGVGASGTAESGLGQGQVTEAQVNRNAQSNEEVRQSTNKVQAANTLMNRTFEDLGTSDTRNTESTTTQKGNLDVNLENFINDQGQDLTEEQQKENASEAGDIVTATAKDSGALIDQWLQSLAGQGYTSQEIANAASIYKQ